AMRGRRWPAGLAELFAFFDDAAAAFDGGADFLHPDFAEFGQEHGFLALIAALIAEVVALLASVTLRLWRAVIVGAGHVSTCSILFRLASAGAYLPSCLCSA